MASQKQSYAYGTPEKQSDIEIKQFSSSTNVKRFVGTISPNVNPQLYYSSNKYTAGLTIQQLRNEKLAWYQMKIEELRTYVESNSQIDKRVLKRIFDWSDSIPGESMESSFLRELNIKVKNLIYENHQLRHNVQHGKDVQKLRLENVRLQKMIMDFERGQTVRETSLDDENRYLRNYIKQKLNNKADFKEYESGARYQEGTQQVIIIERNVGKTNLIDNKLEMINENKYNSEESLGNMKIFFSNYIDAVKQQNDNKLEAQNRYIDTLQKKVRCLEEQIHVKFNHFKFERKVQLQNSVRKSKNFSVETPFIRGEEEVLQDVEQVDSGNALDNASVRKRLLGDRPYRIEQRKSDKQSPQFLKRKIKQLEEDYRYLEEKYAIEIQNHIRDNAKREEALMKVQRLQADNKALVQKANQMGKELKNSQRKISQIQQESIQKKQVNIIYNSHIIPQHTSNDIAEQVKQIRQEIQLCSMNYSKEAEKLINKLVIERDSLQRQLVQIQKITVDQSKNSALQKEIFLLKNQNAHLEKNCRFYEKQIEEYSAQLNELQQQNKSRLLNGFQRQSIQINDKERLRGAALSGVQWQRMAHECMVNSVHRLLHLQNELKKEGNLRA